MRYSVTVYTANVQDAGTNSNIGIRLCDAQGHWTERINLDNDEDNFEQDAVDVFRVDFSIVIGDPIICEMYSDLSGRRSGWLCRGVSITRWFSNEDSPWTADFVNRNNAWCEGENQGLTMRNPTVTHEGL